MTLNEFLAEWHSPSPTLTVHTSGSTGAPKPLEVEKRRMEASARITCDFLGLREGDTALLCMPLDFIAGKMMVVRSLVRGLRLTVVEPTGHPLATVGDKGFDFAAMVPLQVHNSLQIPEEKERITQVRNLIIGGGAIDDELAAALHSFPHAVWSTYGMTETLSHIALRRLSGEGASEWYTPFEGVRIGQNSDGCLVIDAPSVCAKRLETHDIVELDGQRFRVLGRIDNVICSGGVKIQAEEVERLLRPHLESPFMVTRRADPKFGEAVVLLTEGDCAEARTVCERVLPKFWRPKAYVHVDNIPMTATGKPARRQAELLARP